MPTQDGCRVQGSPRPESAAVPGLNFSYCSVGGPEALGAALRKLMCWWHPQGVGQWCLPTSMQLCQHFTTGTAARALDSTASLRPECTPKGAQHLPDPPREIQGPRQQPPSQTTPPPAPFKGTVLNAKEEKADMEGRGTPLSRWGPLRQFHPLPNPHGL